MENKDIDRVVEHITPLLDADEQYKLSPELSEALQNLADTCNRITKKFRFDFLFEQINDYLDKVKDDEKLTQAEFEEKYLFEKELCEDLGRNGWVVTEHGNPREIVTWNKKLKEGNVKGIADSFQGEKEYVFNNIINGLSKKYTDGENKLYFDRAYSFFEIEDYMTFAMYLVGLIEQRCKKRIDFGERRKYEKIFSDVGFEEHLNKHFKNVSEQFMKRFLFLYMYPSLIWFLNRLFVDGEYTFEKGIEPPYVNRNWLLHGKNTRTIERFECIQLFNALSVLEFVCDVS